MHMDSSSLSPHEANRENDAYELVDEEEESLTPDSNQRDKRKHALGVGSPSQQNNNKSPRVLPQGQIYGIIMTNVSTSIAKRFIHVQPSQGLKICGIILKAILDYKHG